MDKIRDIRLMEFSSLLRSLNVVSNARIHQLYPWFLKFEERYPLLDNGQYGRAMDHKNMKKFILKKKNEFFPNSENSFVANEGNKND